MQCNGPAGFCCSLKDNVHKIEFLEFEIKEYDTSRSVFKVSKADQPDMANLCLEDIPEDLVRTVKYKLPADFLKFKTVRTL
mmetsp:Transcript_2419/g.5672  ORF Transcript_2419/g.5672 Transcript_2419/m.5672 type:complete len:81 (+) Transcript_2419:89-331(+)